jgi:cadmium resistance transport/sequestration family protein
MGDVVDVLGTVGAAVGVFAGTNVDDLIVLTVLFLSARASGVPRAWQVWTGQYAGIAVLVAVSALAALGLTLVPDRWVGLLGLVPVALGLSGLIGTFRGRDDDETPPMASGAFPVAGVTIANGGDNIAVYTPMFRTLGIGDSIIVVVVFAVLVAVWCAAASWLGSHSAVIAVLARFGRWLVPAVFVLIGTVIIVESGVVGRLL